MGVTALLGPATAANEAGRPALRARLLAHWRSRCPRQLRLEAATLWRNGGRHSQPPQIVSKQLLHRCPAAEPRALPSLSALALGGSRWALLPGCGAG